MTLKRSSAGYYICFLVRADFPTTADFLVKYFCRYFAEGLQIF